MFRHDDIWRGIDRLASAFGYSPSGLAKQAGLDPTSFNKSKRISADGKPRWPSTESISKVLSVTGATMSEFISLIGLDEDKPPARSTIPLIGFAQAGTEGYFDEDGYPAGEGWDEIPFPHATNEEQDQVFALAVSGDSMEPLFREGDTLIVSPTAKIRKGDRTVVRTSNGEVLAKEIVKQGTKSLTLKSLNENYEDREILKSEITWAARILWVGQ